MIALVIVAVVFAVIAFAFAGWALIQVEAMKRSTHSVQYVDPWKDAMREFEEEVGAAPRARQEFEEITPAKRDAIRDGMNRVPEENQEDEDDAA